ncbi:GyrI-like domain-containing protein [Glaciihabitans arcticus]|nr:GyrI-like domain-containing protein [Glaciihabitans arcticus]
MADLTLPVVAHRESEHYVGIAAKVAIADFGTETPKHFDELAAWAKDHGVQPGLEFIKYDVIDMAGVLSMVFCVVTESAVEGDDRVVAGVLPAGDYGTTTLTGTVDEVFDATAVLVGWAKERGVEWDAADTAEGHAFVSRIERYHTGPGENPEVVEIAIKTR